METNELLANLNDLGGGITVKPSAKSVNKKGYTRLKKDVLNRAGAGLDKLPYLLKMQADQDFYAEAYMVVFDKGLGTLQKSAKNPLLYRANVVGAHGNNDIVGQALLAKLDPSDAMRLSQALLSVYTVASVITSQYFLARIDKRLSSIEETTGKIIRFLENDKKMQQLADNSFLTDKMKMIDYIEQDEAFRQATLVNVQRIKNTADANIRFYQKEIHELLDSTSINDKKYATRKFEGEYQTTLPQYWFAVFIYGFATYLETKLSGITDAKYLDYIEADILTKVVDYRRDVEEIKERILEYFNSVKYLKTHKKLEEQLALYGPLVGLAAGGLAGKTIAEIAADLLKKNNGDKEKVREEMIHKFDLFYEQYTDYEALASSASGIEMLNNVYNKPVQILVENDAVFIKAKPARQTAQLLRT